MAELYGDDAVAAANETSNSDYVQTAASETSNSDYVQTAANENCHAPRIASSKAGNWSQGTR